MKILVAMSGGVDSTVAAALLLDAGHTVCGVTFATDAASLDGEAVCDAQNVARQLGIEHRVLDITKEFDRDVKEYFVSSYEAGETPNPCVVCNREIKFGLVLRYALECGFDAVATGHYARLVKTDDGRTRLYAAKDEKKDQSYVLAALGEESLEKAVFPLGEYTKDEIRAIAEKIGVCTAHKKDSQDICFIPDGDYAAFIEKYRAAPHIPGNYISESGEVLGTHRGHMCYTIGQRRGLGIALGRHMFVLSRCAEDNTVMLGDASSLMKREIYTGAPNLIGCDALPKDVPLEARIRYSHKGAECTVSESDDGMRVEFTAAQRAPTPGQLAVFTCRDDFGLRVLGSAFIRR